MSDSHEERVKALKEGMLVKIDDLDEQMERLKKEMLAKIKSLEEDDPMRERFLGVYELLEEESPQEFEEKLKQAEEINNSIVLNRETKR
ncbi:hypothetical protein AGENTSMITH_140 [Bacillus phage vB_BspM_AgentSmith]|nr:hypothetical protein AGENTSMITH_140 [Bacillus phage vB_BspM_AgentSmith]